MNVLMAVNSIVMVAMTKHIPVAAPTPCWYQRFVNHHFRTANQRPGYSDRRDFTGLVVAALIDSKLTVSHAIASADTKAIRKIVHSIDTW